MAGDTRQRMIRAAATLFRDRGYAGTGFRVIVEQAGATRGSIYHHFPGGKAQLAEEVAHWVGAAVADRIEQIASDSDPVAAVDEFIDLVRTTLVQGRARPGCPVAAVALGADAEEGDLLRVAAQVFRTWERAFVCCLRDHGTTSDRASGLATLTVAATEGALILCRARGDDQPLRRVSGEVRRAVRAGLPPSS